MLLSFEDMTHTQRVEFVTQIILDELRHFKKQRRVPKHWNKGYGICANVQGVVRNKVLANVYDKSVHSYFTDGFWPEPMNILCTLLYHKGVTSHGLFPIDNVNSGLHPMKQFASSMLYRNQQLRLRLKFVKTILRNPHWVTEAVDKALTILEDNFNEQLQ